MRETPPPPRVIGIEVRVLLNLEEYLGDRPRSDKLAADLHARIVDLLDAQGLLKGDAG
jgi:hypothetical protein